MGSSSPSASSSSSGEGSSASAAGAGTADGGSAPSTSSASFTGSASTGGTPFGVIGFRLVDADADLLLGPLSGGDVVDPDDYGGAQLSLAADTLPVEVGSVEFFVDDRDIRIEDFVPFTLGGNIDFDFMPWELTPGIHTIRAVPYELDQAMGTQGVAREVTFELL